MIMLYGIDILLLFLSFKHSMSYRIQLCYITSYYIISEKYHILITPQHFVYFEIDLPQSLNITQYNTHCSVTGSLTAAQTAQRGRVSPSAILLYISIRGKGPGNNYICCSGTCRLYLTADLLVCVVVVAWLSYPGHFSNNFLLYNYLLLFLFIFIFFIFNVFESLQGLARFWPWGCASKQVLFLNELEEVRTYAL